jgi:pyrroloquinoline quinone (PQQ) biosynthesis protein C
MTRSTHPEHDPRQPVSATNSEIDQILHLLLIEARQHRAVSHPWLRAVASGNVPNLEWTLRDFARQYHGYLAAVPCYLQKALDRLDAPRHQRQLEQRLARQQGMLDLAEQAELRRVGIDPRSVRGVPHPLLFRRFAGAMGLADQDLAHPSTASLGWRTRLLGFVTHAHPAAVAGALVMGTEIIAPDVYLPILVGSLRLGSVARADYVFFELLCMVEDPRRNDLMQIAAEWAGEAPGRAELRRGMLLALGLRSEFWDHLHRRAMSVQAVCSA